MDQNDLAERLVGLEARLTLLEDEKAVRELLSRYGYYADTCLDDQYIDLFTDDCVMDVSSGYSGDPYKVLEWRGKESLREFLMARSARHGDGFRGNSLHMQGNNLAIQIDGVDAVATGYSFILCHEDEVGVRLVSASINRWHLDKIEGSWRVRTRTRRAIGAPDSAAILTSSRARNTAQDG
ncbi:nuclear transport factor 2 family protein [Mycobacterium intracellulare]|uniref:nuclear transport factor 2 family protein n=1 Tax=Mycobacterium intracellulare TaxID=1767 RepID=UPI00080BF4B3|nr:nuclear transport factor 2 family protein [Mycobacterium intracellulare]OCB22488.1 hypothetical protein A5689_17805 [Mycobacterium intracellulare subsp. yongonense]